MLGGSRNFVQKKYVPCHKFDFYHNETTVYVHTSIASLNIYLETNQQKRRRVYFFITWNNRISSDTTSRIFSKLVWDVSLGV